MRKTGRKGISVYPGGKPAGILAVQALAALFLMWAPAMQAAAGTGAGQEQDMAKGVQDTVQGVQDTAQVTVSYSNLARLVLENQDLKAENESYETNRANYEALLADLQEERDYMKLMADKYEDDPETEAVYQANAAAFSNSLSQVRRQLERLNSKSSVNSVQDVINSYTLSAQNLMNTYCQMTANVTAKEKSVEAAEAAYEEALAGQGAGTATGAQVLEASDALQKEKNLLFSYRRQAGQARFALLSALNIEDSDHVVVEEIPDPDLTAVQAADLNADVETAVGNSPSVQSVRHSNAGTYTEIALKSDKEAEAEGTVRASVTASYNQLQSAQLQYQAEADAFESASLSYRSLQLKKDAGMVSRTAYLEGEADYYAARAAKDTAALNLTQAWESYGWEIKGVA